MASSPHISLLLVVLPTVALQSLVSVVEYSSDVTCMLVMTGIVVA